MPKHILLIDDDTDDIDLFKEALSETNTLATLDYFYDAGQLLTDFKKLPKLPDIIFLDINLPGADGFECLQTIRNMQACKNIPVYMYSTEITGLTFQRAEELGAGCIKKSRNHDHVANIIREKLRAASPNMVKPQR